MFFEDQFRQVEPHASARIVVAQEASAAVKFSKQLLELPRLNTNTGIGHDDRKITMFFARL